MSFRFLHTADWQIGKPFRNFGDQGKILANARLEVIATLGQLAQTENIRHILVCGDVYDSNAPLPVTLRAPLERMRNFPGVHWHLLPGNHDWYQRGGLWDDVKKAAPPNVHLHLAAEPAELEPGVLLFPAPLRQRHTSADLTEWMDTAPSAEGAIRLGMAHGSVQDFGSGLEGEATNLINPDRARKARLDYLALGDWHRTQAINSRTWYSGTPEPDRVNSQSIGTALLVEIASAGQEPVVTPHTTGTYSWIRIEQDLQDAAAIADFETRVRAMPNLSRTVLHLDLKGILSLEECAALEQRLQHLEAAVHFLEADRAGLSVRPSMEDLQTIDFGGVLRQAAERLTAIATDPALSAAGRRVAQQALLELYVRTRAATGEAQ